MLDCQNNCITEQLTNKRQGRLNKDRALLTKTINSSNFWKTILLVIAQGHYSLGTLPSSGCEDCLILLIHFRFKCKHTTFIKSLQSTSGVLVCFHSEEREESVQTSCSLCASSDFLWSPAPLYRGIFIVRSKLSGHKHWNPIRNSIVLCFKDQQIWTIHSLIIWQWQIQCCLLY